MSSSSSLLVTVEESMPSPVGLELDIAADSGTETIVDLDWIDLIASLSWVSRVPILACIREGKQRTCELSGKHEER